MPSPCDAPTLDPMPDMSTERLEQINRELDRIADEHAEAVQASKEPGSDPTVARLSAKRKELEAEAAALRNPSAPRA